MIWETAKADERHHLLQLTRMQCEHALELDCRSEFRQQIEDLKIRLQTLEATPVPLKS